MTCLGLDLSRSEDIETQLSPLMAKIVRLQDLSLSLSLSPLSLSSVPLKTFFVGRRKKVGTLQCIYSTMQDLSVRQLTAYLSSHT